MKDWFEGSDAYSPVKQMTTVRLLMSTHAADLDVHFVQMDVTAAYLTAKMKNAVYIRMPKGFQAQPNSVHLCDRALYGGKDSGRCFFDEWTDFHKDNSFVGTHYDQCFYQISKGDSFIKLCFHVDDILVAYKGQALFDWYQQQLAGSYQITCGPLKHYIGIKIDRDPKTGAFTLSQGAQIKRLLKLFKLDKLEKLPKTPVGDITPTEEHTPVSEPDKLQAKAYPYMQAVGHLQYLQYYCYPELSYPLKISSKFNSSPSTTAWTWTKHQLKWLAANTYPDFHITGQGDRTVSAYTDANHIKDPDNRRSVSGYVIRFGNDTVDYGSSYQRIVSHSSCESELMALDLCVRRVQFVKRLAEVIGGHQTTDPITVHIDCKSVIDLARNPIQPGRNCHVHARYFYVRDLVADKEISLVKVATADNLADLMVTYKDPTNFHHLTRLVKGVPGYS